MVSKITSDFFGRYRLGSIPNLAKSAFLHIHFSGGYAKIKSALG
jgi:hypothetical protein